MKKRTYFLFLPLVLFACTNPSGPVYDGAGDFNIQSEDITLTATLDLPSSDGPYPAMVIVHGSGIPGRTYGAYANAAEFYVSKGVAVLRYDKRGTGESTGVFTRVNPQNSREQLTTLANDALVGVRFLKQHKAINKNQIGLLGFSQGGWIVPLAASLSSDVAYMIISGGPTVPVGVPTFYQNAITGGSAGPPLTLSDEEIAERLREYTNTAGFDPVPVLESISTPGIWLLGGKDKIIPTGECVRRLESIIQTHNKDYTIVVYPKAGHGMYYQENGRWIIEPSFDDGLNWLNNRFQSK